MKSAKKKTSVARGITSTQLRKKGGGKKRDPAAQLQGIDPATAQAYAQIATRCLEAQRDPVKFLELAWFTPEGDNIELAWFHKEWVHLMTRRRRLLIEAPKGTGKTSLIMALAIWFAGRNPNVRIKIACSTDAKAKERLFEIRENIERNPLIKMVFPDMEIHDTGEQSRMRLFLKRSANMKDATFEAAGVNSSMQGGRADLVVADDICDMRNTIMFPAMRETVKTKFTSEWLGCLEKNGRVWYIANPMHRGDCTSYLKKASGWAMHRTVNGTADDPFKPLWPERHTSDFLKLKAAELGMTEYNRAYRCITLASELTTMKSDWIHYYDAALIGDPERLICVQAYDLAIAQKKHSDFFAGVTVLYNSKQNLIFVADAWKLKLGFTEQARAIIEEAAKWRPDRIAIEAVGYQGALAQYLADKASIPMPIIPMHTRTKKEQRLAQISPLFEDTRIFFHPRLDPVRNPRVMDRGDIVGELMDFPIGGRGRDDLVDAFVYAVMSLQAFRYEEGDEAFLEGEGVRTRIMSVGV